MKAKALIIGNANYPNDNLVIPENDANDFKDTLTRLGFEATVLLNINTVTQDKYITDFANSLDSYDIGIFYFAGHGFQIDNENYLASIDTNFDDPEHARHTAFPLNILLSYFNKATNKTNIIILDTCRNLLNKKSWYRNVENSGLAPIHAPKGTIIAFATSPGEKALNGTGKRNGIYTGALLQHIVAENIPIEEMFKRVRNTVYAFSKGKQTSWEHTSLTGTFCFNSGQLTHSSSLEYGSQAIKDSLYEINTNTHIDTLIKDLKSHDWYTQNPAIEKLKSIDPAKEDKNKLFLLGRNILQSACGGSKSAISFMDNLENNVSRFNVGDRNHVLNGIIYETFFNSYGSFRQDNIKDLYFEKIYKILENKLYKESLNFLTIVLKPYNDMFFYIPSINSTGISLDLVFEIDSVLDKTKLTNIKYEGQEILVKQEYEEIWGFPGINTGVNLYTNIRYKNLKKRIAKETLIPENKLNINTNIPIIDDQVINYPDNYKIMK